MCSDQIWPIGYRHTITITPTRLPHLRLYTNRPNNKLREWRIVNKVSWWLNVYTIYIYIIYGIEKLRVWRWWVCIASKTNHLNKLCEKHRKFAQKWCDIRNCGHRSWVVSRTRRCGVSFQLITFEQFNAQNWFALFKAIIYSIFLVRFTIFHSILNFLSKQHTNFFFLEYVFFYDTQLCPRPKVIVRFAIQTHVSRL